MTMFVIHDQEGRVSYTAEVADTAGYEQLLRSRDERFIKALAAEAYALLQDGENLIEHCYVNGLGKLVKKPALQVTFSAETVSADQPLTVGAQVGTKVTIQSDWVHDTIVMDEKEEEFAFSTPGTYRLTFELFPYIPTTKEIQVVS